MPITTVEHVAAERSSQTVSILLVGDNPVKLLVLENVLAPLGPLYSETTSSRALRGSLYRIITICDNSTSILA